MKLVNLEEIDNLEQHLLRDLAVTPEEIKDLCHYARIGLQVTLNPSYPESTTQFVVSPKPK